MLDAAGRHQRARLAALTAWARNREQKLMDAQRGNESLMHKHHYGSARAWSAKAHLLKAKKKVEDKSRPEAAFIEDINHREAKPNGH